MIDANRSLREFIKRRKKECSGVKPGYSGLILDTEGETLLNILNKGLDKK